MLYKFKWGIKMRKFKLRKGNFYNQLTNSIDSRIIDGNQYDLELTINNQQFYYRVRFIDGAIEACPINLKNNEFVAHSTFNNMEEITSFFETDFYRHEFEFYKDLEVVRRMLDQKDVFRNPDYYYFIRKMLKKNQLKGQTLYEFSLPANERREKRGVLSYDISIECAKNFYYLFFLREAAEKSYPQSDKDIYFIYSRPDFKDLKREFENKILDLCIIKDLPVNLTSLIYLISDGKEDLIEAIYKDILNAKSKKDAELLIFSKYLQQLKPSLIYDSNLQREFKEYINTDKNDINYDFARKRV